MRDVDVLLGVEWVTFRLANRDFASMGSKEIARVMNDDLRQNLWPQTKEWRGQYEVTFYVNAAEDIRDISPYAAYDLIADGWTVPPTKDAPVVPKEYEVAVGAWHDRAKQVVQRYSHMLTGVQNATSPVARVNAEVGFRATVAQAESLFNEIHQARRASFTEGHGYADWGNYLWQSGKQHGWLPALRQIKEFAEADRKSRDVQTYGVELPDQDVLLRRAALAYRTKASCSRRGGTRPSPRASSCSAPSSSAIAWW
jgi:hypothetical protein